MSGNKTAAFIIHSAASYPAASKDASSSDFRRLAYPAIEKGASTKAAAPTDGDIAKAEVKSAIIFPYKGTQMDERRNGSGGEELAVAEPYQDYEVLLSVQVSHGCLFLPFWTDGLQPFLSLCCLCCRIRVLCLVQAWAAP
jgi:hypothetical protein